MKSITKFSALLLAAALSMAWPALAQTDTTPSATNAPVAPKPRRQFTGTIASIDTTNMILMLKARGTNSETKVKITSTTKIKKDGEPGEFSDAAEGMHVSGAGKKDEEGVWTARTLNIRTKPAARKKPAVPTPPPSAQ